MPVLFLSDVEGRWDKLVDFCADNAWVRLEGERLSLSPGATLVFGGDTIDDTRAAVTAYLKLLKKR